MKIDYSLKSLKTSGNVEAKKTSPTPAADKTPGQPKESELQLSPLMSHAKQMAETMPKTPAFDQKKVDELKDAIAAGKFKINPEAIAERLLKSVGDFVGQPI